MMDANKSSDCKLAETSQHLNYDTAAIASAMLENLMPIAPSPSSAPSPQGGIPVSGNPMGSKTVENAAPLSPIEKESSAFINTSTHPGDHPFAMKIAEESLKQLTNSFPSPSATMPLGGVSPSPTETPESPDLETMETSGSDESRQNELALLKNMQDFPFQQAIDPQALSQLGNEMDIQLPSLEQMPATSDTEVGHLYELQNMSSPMDIGQLDKHGVSEHFRGLASGFSFDTPVQYGPATSQERSGSSGSPLGFDVNRYRKDFPILHRKVNGKPLIWMDNGATTQKPSVVMEAITDYYERYNSNIHRGAHELAREATDAYEEAREKVKTFIGARSKDEIIFVRGTTEGINLVANSFGKGFLNEGDEIIVSELEHHANIVPWQFIAKEMGAKLVIARTDQNGDILLDEFRQLFTNRTKIVTISQASNAIGTIVPVREMIKIAHSNNVPVLVDAAQSVQHMPVNVLDLDADFFVFSGHKIFAPMGIGIVYGKKELLEKMPPWQGGGAMIKDVTFEHTQFSEVPTKFEAGTPNVEGPIGLGAALDYLSQIGMHNIERYEHQITEYALRKLKTIPRLKLIGSPKNRISVLSFVIEGIENEVIGKALNNEGIAVRVGHHCAQPILRKMGHETAVRPSLAFYNTYEEVDFLVETLKSIERRES